MWKRAPLAYAVLIVIYVLLTSPGVFADTVPRMTVDQLESRLGADDLVVLDVRSSRDWNTADTLIAGALRVEPAEVNQWSGTLPKQKTFVLYCT